MSKIISINCISKDIYDMTILAPDVTSTVTAGQFVNVYLNDRSKLLPRPISICSFSRNDRTIRLVFRIAGEGTKELSEMKAGDDIRIMGPLGNGFLDVPERNAVLFGGGIGIPPMLGLARKLHSEGLSVHAFLGYRNSDTFLADEFEKYATVHIATDDGSTGFYGNVVQALEDATDKGEVSSDDTCLYACGPLPMLRGIKKAAGELNIPAQISMEERMACGIGACLACVCNSTEVDPHSNVRNKRVCKDGPVFFADEIEL